MFTSLRISRRIKKITFLISGEREKKIIHPRKLDDEIDDQNVNRFFTMKSRND